MAHTPLESTAEFSDDSGYESALETPPTPVSDAGITSHLQLHPRPDTNAAVLLALCDTLPSLLTQHSSGDGLFRRSSRCYYRSKRSSFNGSVAWWEDRRIIISVLSQISLISQLIDDRIAELTLRYVELKLELGDSVAGAKSRYTTPTAEEMALGILREEMRVLVAAKRELLS